MRNCVWWLLATFTNISLFWSWLRQIRYLPSSSILVCHICNINYILKGPLLWLPNMSRIFSVEVSFVPVLSPVPASLAVSLTFVCASEGDTQIDKWSAPAVKLVAWHHRGRQFRTRSNMMFRRMISKAMSLLSRTMETVILTTLEEIVVSDSPSLNML